MDNSTLTAERLEVHIPLDDVCLNKAAIIHEYPELDLAILKYIAEKGWRSLVSFCAELGLNINPSLQIRK